MTRYRVTETRSFGTSAEWERLPLLAPAEPVKASRGQRLRVITLLAILSLAFVICLGWLLS